MKKLLVIAGLLFSIASQAQVGELFGGTANVFAVDDNTGPQFIFRAFFNEAASRWTGDSTQVGDHVFVFSGNKVYRLTVDSILAESSALVTLRVRDSTATLASFPTGVCALMRLTDNNLYPATIPGLPNVLGSKITTYFAEQAELAVGGSGTGVTTGVKGDINVVGADSDWQIVADAVGNPEMANMPAGTIKANLTGGSANPTDATYAQIKAALGANEYCRDTITQTAHGFSKAEAIYYDGTEYVSMIGLHGDSQEPHFLVIDSTTVNTFVVAACGIVNDTLGLVEGLYYSTDTGLDLSPDTVEYPIAKVFDGKTIVMSLPGFEFNATGKPLLDALTISGQRTLDGGDVIPMFPDSIPFIDTVLGVPFVSVGTGLRALIAAIEAIPTAIIAATDSLVKSDNTLGTGASGYTGFFNTLGRLTGDADYFWDNTNNGLRLTKDALGITVPSTGGLLLRTTSTATGGLSQMPPPILWQFSGWNGSSAVTLNTRMYWTPITTGSIAGAEVNIDYETANLFKIRRGQSILTHMFSIGAGHTLPTGGAYGIMGLDNVVQTGASSAFGFGRNVTIGAQRTAAVGTNLTANNDDSVLFGGQLRTTASRTVLVGNGLSTTATTSAGTGLISDGDLAQFRIQGFSTISANNWTASGAVVTLTSGVATLEIGQGIVLVGATTSYRTIIAVSSTTVFTVNSNPAVSSGTQIRPQIADILQIGDGTINYNSHMVIDRSGRVGFGITTPTSKIDLQAGTALVAPFGFTAGTNLTTPLAGKMEWDGTNLFITQTAGPTRKTLAYTTDVVATNLSLSGSGNKLVLDNSNGTSVVFKGGSGIAIQEVVGTRDTAYISTVEHWGETSISGGSTSVTTGTPEQPDNDTPGTATVNLSSEYTQTGSTINYIGASGQVEITGSVNFVPTTGGDYLISIFKEGVEITSTEVRVTAPLAVYTSVSLPKVNVSVATNDTFDLRIEPVSGSDTITVYRYSVYSRKIY